MSTLAPFLVRARKTIDIDQLTQMDSRGLHKLHQELFGRNTPAGNTECARRKIAWHVQASVAGSLPQSAREHALAIARELGARVLVAANLERRREGLPVEHAVMTGITHHDSRVPMPGSVIVKTYRGTNIVVHVLDAGFEYNGKRFDSLTALAKEITGTKWNGLAFFGLAKGKRNGR